MPKLYRLSTVLSLLFSALVLTSCSLLPSAVETSSPRPPADRAEGSPEPRSQRTAGPQTTSPQETGSQEQANSPVGAETAVQEDSNDFSTAGLTSFINHWVQAHNQAILTGDVEAAQQLVSPENTFFHKEYTIAQHIYRSGGHIEGAKTEVTILPGQMTDVGSGGYGLLIEYSFTPGITHLNDRQLLTTEPAVDKEIMVAIAEHDGTRWQLMTLMHPE